MKQKLIVCTGLALMLCLLAALALADQVYVLTPAEINQEALLNAAFGDAASQAQLEKRANGYQFWSLDKEGTPFCGMGTMLRQQQDILTGFNIYRESDERYGYNLDYTNVIAAESGLNAPYAAEAIARTEELLAQLGIEGAEVVSFETLGREKDMLPSCRVVLQRVLNGRPVRWASDNLDFDRLYLTDGFHITTVWSEEMGLLKIEGEWGNFHPTGDEQSTLTQAEARERFTAYGRSAAELEACYFLRWDGISRQATATPAWRSGVNYLNALTGEWLQLD